MILHICKGWCCLVFGWFFFFFFFLNCRNTNAEITRNFFFLRKYAYTQYFKYIEKFSMVIMLDSYASIAVDEICRLTSMKLQWDSLILKLVQNLFSSPKNIQLENWYILVDWKSGKKQTPDKRAKEKKALNEWFRGSKQVQSTLTILWASTLPFVSMIFFLSIVAQQVNSCLFGTPSWLTHSSCELK